MRRASSMLLLLFACRGPTTEVGADIVDPDGDGYGADIDCDDTNKIVFPGAVEWCDSVDNNCDGKVDEASAVDAGAWYADADGDGFGNASFVRLSCARPEGWAASPNDCDDTRADVHPGALEFCDGVDTNCNEALDDVATVTTWFEDLDGDGFGGGDDVESACAPGPNWVSNESDCDDSDPTSYPGALEWCDQADNDCNTVVDDHPVDPVPLYTDADGDGFGQWDDFIFACTETSTTSYDAGDCDDDASSVFPGATETCDGVDEDCDGVVDDGVAGSLPWYLDDDGDGWGGSHLTVACAPPSGKWVDTGGDCDDANTEYHPLNVQCDGLDHDCDGLVDNDGDADGFADESCGGDDCDDANFSVNPSVPNSCDFRQSCKTILDAGGSTGDGYYVIDPDGEQTGEEPFEVWCDMTTHGGGYTLVGSFVNIDNVYAWTSMDGLAFDNAGVWRNADPFGFAQFHTTFDHKSPAYAAVAATDLLAVDSAGNWASFDGAVWGGTLLDTVLGYTDCSASWIPGVTVDSSDATMAAGGQITFYGVDGDAQACPHPGGLDTEASASVLTLAGDGCSTTGFGNTRAALEGDGSDAAFCLAQPPSTVPGACGNAFGAGPSPVSFSEGCDYALLLVR